jgi:hypothetical protein
MQSSFRTNLLFFNGSEDFLMTLCDFEQQTTLSVRQDNLDKHPWHSPSIHRMRGTRNN